MKLRPLISITIPAYNEEANLGALFERLEAITSQADGYDFEFILLDNCSTDRTEEIAAGRCAQDRRWKYVRYSRNFGAEASLLAGLDFASGDAVINLFSDLQDPPEKIPLMLDLWKKGNDVVYGLVKERNDSSVLKTVGAKVAYRMIRMLAECDIPEHATDLRLLDRKVVLTLKNLRESDRYMRGLVHWVGFRQAGFEYDRAMREQGNSSANLAYCVKFALHAIVCFSSKPMHLSMLFGLTLTAASVIAGFLSIMLYFVRPSFISAPPAGMTTLILLGLFVLGTNALFIGIVVEYVGRIYRQGKERPVYIVDRMVNL